jgi:hypothetical protein
MRVTSSARVLVMGGAIGIATLVACGDPGPHNNPYDPNVPVTALLTGPDTLFSYSEIANLGAQFTPAFPDSAVSWDLAPVFLSVSATCDTFALGSHFLEPAGAGSFRSASPPLEPLTLSIVVAASVGAIDTTVSRVLAPQSCTGGGGGGPPTTIRTTEYRHSAYKTVVLTQRLTRLQLRCPDTHACDTLAAGGSWSVWVDGFDALGGGIYTLRSDFAPAHSTTNPTTGPPIASYVSRDTTVASLVPVGVRVATVTARQSGATWIVANRGALRDSLQLVVR